MKEEMIIDNMTQEEKQLLLQDLCARLPYGVKCNVWYGPKSPALNEKDKYTDDILETINPKKGNCTFHHAIGYDFGFFPVEHVKPYLRQMSSMTEKEKNEIEEITECNFHVINDGSIVSNNSYAGAVFTSHYDAFKIVDWLNKNHFDYRGLIPMGLALEALEGMYN